MARSVGVDYFAPDNPDAPYFAIKIEDTIYDIDVNYIENLTVNRVMDDIGTFSFTIVDVADDDPVNTLEDRFLMLFQAYEKTYPPISFQYGWSLGEKSPWYRGYMKNFNPEYIAGGFHRISVEGQLLAASATTEGVQAHKGMSVSDIVRGIADEQGWVIDDMDESVMFDEERTFRVTNVNPIDYIRKELEPYAVNAKNEPFRLYTETLDGGETHIRFISVNKPVDIQKNYNFFINMGNYGSVLSWSPKYSGLTMNAFMQNAVVDSDTNDVRMYGSDEKSPAPEGAALTVYGSTSPDRMGPLLANKWYQTNIGSISASMEIVGDPTLVPYQSINVIPMLAGGKIHRYSAGTYQIRQITDNLSQDYRTSMELFMTGVEDGTKTMPLENAVKFQGFE